MRRIRLRQPLRSIDQNVPLKKRVPINDHDDSKDDSTLDETTLETTDINDKSRWRELIRSMPTKLDCAPKETPSHFWNKEVVAIGDVHGDLEALLRMLHSANLIDDSGDWSCRNVLAILCGDVVDRGRPKGGSGRVEPDKDEETKLICYICRMNRNRAGNRIIHLMGNHELMRVQGDERYKGEQAIMEKGHLKNYLRDNTLLTVTVHNNKRMCVFCHTLPDKADFARRTKHEYQQMMIEDMENKSEDERQWYSDDATGAEMLNQMLKSFLTEGELSEERSRNVRKQIAKFTWGRDVAQKPCSEIRHMEYLLWWLHGQQVPSCKPYVAIGHTNQDHRLKPELRCDMIVLLDVRLSAGFRDNGEGYLRFPSFANSLTI